MDGNYTYLVVFVEFILVLLTTEPKKSTEIFNQRLHFSFALSSFLTSAWIWIFERVNNANFQLLCSNFKIFKPLRLLSTNNSEIFTGNIKTNSIYLNYPAVI